MRAFTYIANTIDEDDPTNTYKISGIVAAKDYGAAARKVEKYCTVPTTGECLLIDLNIWEIESFEGLISSDIIRDILSELPESEY